MDMSEDMDPLSLRTKSAIKVTIGTVLASVIALHEHFPNPFWSGMIVIMLFDQDTQSSLQRIIGRVIGVVIGGMIGLIITYFFANDPLLTVLFIFLTASIAVYGVLVDSTVWLGLGVTAIFVQLLTAYAPNVAFLTNLWRTIETLNGVLAGAFAAFFFWPITPSDLYPKTTKTLVQDLIDAFDQIARAYENQQPYTISSDKKKTLLMQIHQIEQYGSHHHQCGQNQARVRLVKQLSSQLTVCMRTLHWMAENLVDLPKPSEHWYPLKDALRQQLSGLTQIMLDGEDRRSHASNEDHWHTYSQVLAKEKQNKAQILSWVATLQSFQDALNDLHQTNHDLYVHDHERLNISWAQQWKEGWKKWTTPLRTRPDILHQSLKMGLVVVAIFYAWLLTDWYGAIAAVISGFTVGTDLYTAKNNQKIWLRFLGTIGGAALGIVFTIFLVHDLPTMLFWLIIGSFGLAYYAGGGFAQMYSGWMAMMSFVICMVADNAMATDVDFSFERCGGLLLGLIIVFLANNFFFPHQPKRSMRVKNGILLKKAVSAIALIGKFASTMHPTVQKDLRTLTQEARKIFADGDATMMVSNLKQPWSHLKLAILRLEHVTHHLSDKTMALLHAHLPQDFHTSADLWHQEWIHQSSTEASQVVLTQLTQTIDYITDLEAPLLDKSQAILILHYLKAFVYEMNQVQIGPESCTLPSIPLASGIHSG